MPFDGSFNLLRLDSNVPLGDSCGAVLEQLLDKDDVIVVVPIYLGCIKFPKTVGADSLEAQVVTDQLELLLYRPFGDWEDNAVCTDLMVQAVAAQELIECQGHRKGPRFSGFFLRNIQPIPFPVPDDINEPQPQDVRDTQAQVGFQH